MLPINHLMITGKGMKNETRNFLSGTLLNLLNIIGQKGLDTKLVDILGLNDTYAFRRDKSILLVFSCSRFWPQQVLSEFDLTEEFLFDAEIADPHSIDFPSDVDSPLLFSTPEWNTMLSKQLHCINPTTVIFPASFVGLQGSEAEDAHRKVAAVLLPMCENDIDRKMRLVRVNPIFRGRDFLLDPHLCFVFMEFKSPFLEIYDRLIAPTVQAEGFTPRKSNDIFSTTSVIEDIWENINQAALIIAEISTNNPNVMYELGICHTIGKNVMMITQNPEVIPFNFRHMRCYPYTNDIPGSDELKRCIRSVIQHLKATDLKHYGML